MAPLLSLDAVSKCYWRGPSEVPVLRGASLEVKPGEFVAIWGKRGSGKTTLMRIAAGLETPDHGTVRFEGDDLSMLSEAEHAHLMREQVGWVRRAGPRSELSMLDYVALPLLVAHGQRRANGRASDALQRVGMLQCAGQHWGSLSDGERVLVAIAHGVARTPRLLLVDDPTSHLGMREREEIVDLLRSLVQEMGVAVLMTAPDMPATLRSDQLRALSGGRLLVPPESPSGESNVIKLRGRERFA